MEGDIMRSSYLLFAWITLSFISSYAAVTSPNTFESRIIVQNGHLKIMGGEGRNISIQTSSEGFFNLNGENFLKLVAQAKAATTIVESLGTENTVSYLERTFFTNDEISQRLNVLESMVANLTSINVPQQVRRLKSFVNKFRRLSVINECSSSPCQNGGTCVDIYNDVRCLCPPHWQGKFCHVDVNECTQFAGTELGCQNGATCINSPGLYECHCTPGWFGIHCTVKIDSCSTASNQELCGNGICVPLQFAPGHTCICNQGWTKEIGGIACTADINECTAFTPACSHDPPVVCINHPGSFTCGPCPQGFTGNGHYCSDYNECLINNGGCSMSPYVPCINTRGSRLCGSCPINFVGDGVTCVKTPPCEINNGECHPLARCFANPRISQSYVECICPSGYTGDGLGPAGCRPVSSGGGGSNIADPCLSHPCLHGGTCSASIYSPFFSCMCLPGFEGPHCERRDPCQSNPCQNGGTCVASTDSTAFNCQCSQDYTGDYCQTQQQACGGTLRGSSGVLQFPAAGSERYTHGTDCVWLLITNSTQVLNVTFTKFSLEEAPSCPFDWLQIHDGRGAGDHMIGRYCGSTRPGGGNIISVQNTLFLWFSSDHSRAHDGFELEWNSIPPVCGGRIETNSHGAVQSPGSPGKYPANRDCYWQIMVPPGSRIQIVFFTLQIEAHPNCSYDFLEVRDGLEPSSPLLNRYCNSSLPAPLVSSGSHVLLYFHSDSSSSDYGFQLTFSKVAGTPGCGGMNTDPIGEIFSPNNPNDYVHNIHCQWVIRLPIGERIKITFTRFHIEDSRGCIFDYLEILDGNDESSPLVARLCGITVPRPYISTGNAMMIQFKTDASVSGKGFHLRYEIACGGVYTQLNGIIHSPYYPNPYPGNKECMYHIALPQQNAIKLTFQDLELESSPVCQLDFIEVRDGDYENSTLIGKYCGGVHNLPPVIISSLNHLWLKFKTDYSIHKRGFLANYTSIPLSCGGILTSPTGIITSPTHPEQYPPNLECVWVIRGEPGKVVQLTWNTFYLEMHDSCIFDSVQVFDNSSVNGDVLMGRYCGRMLPPVMLTTENVMTIIFQTDSGTSYDGFSVQYTLIDATTICGGRYFSTTGVITSPGYPNGYLPSKNCTWIIQVPPGQQIKINITEFELESTFQCSYDFLEIRNGAHVNSPLVGKFCGRRINNQITSISNQLYIHFVTDSSVNLLGFKMTWDGTSTGCGGTLTSPTGSIQSPNYPHSSGRVAECIWKISISMGSKISLIFADFDLEESLRCQNVYVEIRDGGDGRAPTIGTFCKDHPIQLFSSTNHLWIKFRSDYNIQGRGFHFIYATDCNGELTGHRGVLESPNFPDPYPSSVECTWKITAPMGNRLNISFSHFHLESGSNTSCQHDFVEIKEGPPKNDARNTLIGKYCGMELPPPITSTMARVLLHFKSDVSVAHIGFRLEWIVNGCGGTFTKPSGRFTSPGYPGHYPRLTACMWQIEVQWGQSIEVTVNNIEMERSRSCILDSLQIYGGPDKKSPMLLNFCHIQNHSMVVTTSGNSALVTFRSDNSFEAKGFEITYRSVASLCGGNFTAPNGSIHSRNYPQNYEARDECYWLIKVDKNHIIKFEIIEFDVESGRNCSFDYVNVFDGETESDNMLLHHCGPNLPNPSQFYSTGNALLVRMRTNSSVAAKGFIANYSIACGAHIIVEDEGELEASVALEIYHRRNNSCTWILEGAKPNDQITLTISRLLVSMNEEANDLNCGRNYLEVLDGRDANAPLIDKYCGSALPHHITSTGSALYIHYVYSSAYSISPFKAFYSTLKTACGGELIAEHGAFASPGIPGSYPNNAECIWTINTSPGNKAMLSFRTFNVEVSDNCDWDYLEIREGKSDGNLIGVYCGNAIPNNITASAKFWIKFRSNEFGTSLGFVADYSMLHGNEVYGPRGQIASSMYPHPFINSGTYTWRITVDNGMAILITFEDFFVESFYENCESFLKLLDGNDESAPVLLKNCLSNRPPPMTSSSNVIYIIFKVRYIRLGSWFLLNWLEVPQVRLPTSGSMRTPISIPGCGGLFAVGRNPIQFTSPGYPNGYDRNLNCEWIFETSTYDHIVIAVKAMDLPASPYCPNSDSLGIYNGRGGNQEWDLVKTYCLPNSTREAPVHGSNLMKAVFQSDSYRNGSGFSAEVFSQCGGTLKGPNGVIDALNLNSSNVWIFCQWNITVKAGRTIIVEFDDFDISDLATNVFRILTSDTVCVDSYVMFRNGASPTSPYLGNGKYCGTQVPVVPETIGNQMHITFTAIIGTKGFKLRYREKSLSCGGHTILSDQTRHFEISSPNFPNIPPPHIECEWIFLAPAGEGIHLDFLEHFDLTETDGCSKEYVEVRNGGTQNSDSIGKFCREMPGTQSSAGNIMYVKYFTDEEEPRNGFKAKASIASCGGTVRGTHSVVISPNYPGPYPSNSECIWNIISQNYHSVKLTFNHVNFPQNGNCSSTDHVIITEKANIFQTERILAVICGSEPIPPIQASSNEVEVKFLSKRNTGNFKGFSLYFETLVEPCGGHLDGMPSGIIESPGYPNAILHKRICSWQISVPKGRRIRVQFQDLDLAGSPTNCIHKLAFFNGIGYLNMMKIFCGSIAPEPVDSTSNYIVIYFVVEGATTHRGFRATYSSDLPTSCEGDFSSSSGIITSPRLHNLTSFFCKWERQENAASNHTVTLTLLNSQIGKRSLGDCFRYPSSVVITNGNTIILDALCGNYTSPKIVTNPYPVTTIVARQSLNWINSGGVNNFTLRYSVFDCGGILVGPTEAITSPNFPLDYPPNMDCVWALNYPEGQQIKLKFDNMSLENGCANDYLAVRNGGTPKSPLIGIYCGNRIPEDIQSQSNQLWLFFHSNIANQASGFKLIAEAVAEGCGGVMHGNSGEVSSPNYPKQYGNNVECLWEINVVQGYHIGLTFVDRFQLEGSGRCSADFVEVFTHENDTLVSLGKVCGRNMPMPFNSTGNKMRILFRTNNSTKGDGFKAQWNVNCGSVISNKNGFLTSPGYPHYYGNNLFCEYNITAPGEIIIAEFQHFNVEKDPNCGYDNLTAYTVENRDHPQRKLGPYCGTEMPPTIRGFGNIRFVFQTDSWDQGTGFFIKYRVETCGGYINSPGLITPPTHENAYFGGLNCTWVIQAPENQVVVLMFKYFHLEVSGMCSYDHVSVYDEAYVNPEKRLARFCGNLDSEPPVIRSTNRTMTVQFATDSSIQSKGFKASVSFTYGESSGCGGTKNLSHNRPMSLSSPRVTKNSHYETFLDCHWLVIGTPQQMLTVDFKEMDLTPCPVGTNAQCDCDFIEIRDGAGPFSDLIGKYCGSTIPARITSSSNRLWVRFKTDDSGNGQGFQINITSVPSPCGPEKVLRATNTSKVLSSPNYPNNYPSNLRCHWFLTSEGQGSRFDIHFKDMDIEDSKSCDSDRLEIYDTTVSGVITEGYGRRFVHQGKVQFEHPIMSSLSPWQISRFCGVGHPSDFYSGGNQVEIKFITDSANTSRGFQLEYQLEGCNRNFTREQGRILTSNGGRYNECLITVQGKPNHTISLYFNNFRLASGSGGTPSTMEIRDGLYSTSPLIAQLSGFRIPNPVFSRSSAISIKMRFSTIHPFERYDITYVTTDKGRGCGGRIFNYVGKFTSPLYPLNIRNETRCRWEVTVPGGSVVVLQFLEFNLGPRKYCETDYVNIYDVDNMSSSEVLRSRFCGEDNPARVLAASNTVIVESVTSVNNAGSGWVISFAATKQGSTVP